MTTWVDTRGKGESAEFILDDNGSQIVIDRRTMIELTLKGAVSNARYLPVKNGVLVKRDCKSNKRGFTVISVNKNGNSVQSYTITDGSGMRNVGKITLAELIRRGCVLNATIQEYNGSTIIRVKDIA